MCLFIYAIRGHQLQLEDPWKVNYAVIVGQVGPGRSGIRQAPWLLSLFYMLHPPSLALSLCAYLRAWRWSCAKNFANVIHKSKVHGVHVFQSTITPVMNRMRWTLRDLRLHIFRVLFFSHSSRPSPSEALSMEFVLPTPPHTSQTGLTFSREHHIL